MSKLFVNIVAEYEAHCQQVSELSTGDSGIERILLKEEDRLEGNGPVQIQRYLCNVRQLQVQVVKVADDFMFRADCCEEDTSEEGHASRWPFS